VAEEVEVVEVEVVEVVIRVEVAEAKYRGPAEIARNLEYCRLHRLHHLL